MAADPMSRHYPSLTPAERFALVVEALALARRDMAEADRLEDEVMQTVADTLRHATGEAQAADLLAQWEGFGRFCRESLGLEPTTLLAAFRLGDTDPAAEILGSYPDTRADEAEAARWAGDWARVWGGRFGAER